MRKASLGPTVSYINGRGKSSLRGPGCWPPAGARKGPGDKGSEGMKHRYDTGRSSVDCPGQSLSATKGWRLLTHALLGCVLSSLTMVFHCCRLAVFPEMPKYR